MLEMEQTNKYNDLFFEKQRRNNNGSNNNESRTTSILDQFHQSYLDPSRNGRLQTINDDENEEKVGTKTTTTKRSISARPVGPALVEDVVDEWDEFARFLEHILDVYAYRDSSLFIDEFRRLEAYLMAEYEQNEETAEMGDDAERATVYFMNQQQIADHLNDLIKIKQFQLSQSKALFESTKNSFFELLEVKLSPNNLNECQARFDKYCQNYFFIFDQIKSKLKLKMSKYENYIKIWNDFDSDCEDLDLTFEELKDKRINCNLKYRSKELEITNVLNRLKAGLCSLAPVCHENKYYELKQKIIQYEIALKNFRSQNEQLLNQRSKLTTSTPSAQQKSVDIQIDRHVYKEDNSENRMMSFADLEEHRPPRERRNNSSSIYYEPLSMRQKVRPTTVTPIRIDRDYADDLDDEEEVSDEYVDTDYMVRSVSSRSAVKRPPFVGFSDLSPANRSMRRRRFNGVQMSDKSTATINDCATQTDSFRDERELPLDIDSMGESNKQHERQQQHEPLTRYKDTTPVKSSSTSGADLDHHHNHLVETEGKKLLLEAYLRTNDNLALIKQQQQQQGQQNQENKTSDHHHNDTTTATSTPNKTPSSSQQSSQMMAKKPSHHHHRHNSKHTDTITVTTSGIGTATNDEEEEADDDDGHNTTTSSNQSMYDEFLYKNGHKLTVVEENIEPSVGQSTSRRRKSSKKQQQGDQQIQQQQQPSNEPSSKKLLKLLPLKAPVSVGASSSSCSTLDLDSKRHPRREKFLPFLSQKQAAKAKLSTLDNNATNSAARKSDVDQVDTKQRASIFQRLLQYVLLFLIPLLFIILVYFIYIYFLNPSCCDFKRNYLFINVS